jgi:hypothetical protein
MVGQFVVLRSAMAGPRPGPEPAPVLERPGRRGRGARTAPRGLRSSPAALTGLGNGCSASAQPQPSSADDRELQRAVGEDFSGFLEVIELPMERRNQSLEASDSEARSAITRPMIWRACRP